MDSQVVNETSLALVLASQTADRLQILTVKIRAQITSARETFTSTQKPLCRNS
jgi:hypothetical protein